MPPIPWKKFSREEIVVILNESQSISDLTKRLGYHTRNARTRKQIDNMLAFHNLQLPTYNKLNYFNTTQQKKKICAICGKEFVIETGAQNNRKYCYDCSPQTNNPTFKANAMKIKVVELRGGKCEKCGYDKCIDALEFHHLDPAIKEFELGNTGGLPSFEKYLEEASKCILLCANCHREEHWHLKQIKK